MKEGRVLLNEVYIIVGDSVAGLVVDGLLVEEVVVEEVVN